VVVLCISSSFTFGTFLFCLVRRFAMGSVWIGFVRCLRARAMQPIWSRQNQYQG
jgi:hypothetical protein